ncbi:TIR domain-containing protein [Nodosilinea sp. LEGE 06152]|uniref:toll/interleukin-1 receptor domain-containing protein n=1 Tax=Nodosilinea sp. LEGE 06152 TaxID=2777966 RepID=UPI00187E8786|nr:TIR domain-containing protein [Nodosilinea sp. LEGE 06152]MBE9156906.1 TIR domain-containing protein [Nodosilinea sp. LEGE 06152]
MSSLSHSDKRKLEKLFGMASGYVLDFSNRTFSDFMQDAAGVDIYDSKYEYASGSKANRLRAFWTQEPDDLVSKVLEDLIELAEDNSSSDMKEVLAARKIALRLKGDKTLEVSTEDRQSTAGSASSDTGTSFLYDVSLSFAGEQRDYVSRVANYLKEAEISVFYDEFEDLWGKDLAIELEKVYSSDSQYIVIFVSQDYINKSWTNHERQSALAGRISRRDDSVLPVHFDSTKLPGLPSTVAYLSISNVTPEDLALRIVKKLRK